MHRWTLATGLALVTLCAAAAAAATPREMLVNAAFTARDHATAETQVNAARAGAEAILARNPNDREARMQRALAIGYLAKLHASRSEATLARKLFEELAAANPRDPEAQMAIAGWHLNAIDDVGAMLAGAVLGAKKATGFAAMDQAVALSRGQAAFPAMAGMMRIRANPKDMANARNLIEASLKTPAPSPFDRAMQQGAAQVLVPLKGGDGARAAALARLLLPFGRVPKK